MNFLGTFTAGGLEVNAVDGKLEIVKEGSVKKFVQKTRLVIATRLIFPGLRRSATHGLPATL